MGRRKSPLEDVVELASLLPWWVSALLAVVTWVALGAYAASEAPAVPGQPLSSVSGALPRALAGVGKYVLTFCFLLGAGISAFRKVRDRRLVRAVAGHDPGRAASKPVPSRPAQDPLMTMSWQNFEHLVGEVFRRRGYAVSETPRGADGGVDLVLRREAEVVLVQCKHWRSRDVGVTVVRELFGIVAARGAARGVVVTAGRFTKEAQDFAAGAGVELIDGDGLRLQARLAELSSPSLDVPPPTGPGGSVPQCPTCESPMVERTAARGPNAGRRFWGCSRYPKCRGIRTIETGQ